MSHFRSRAISNYGYFGQAVGAFGGGGFEVFPGGPSFQGGDSFNIFFDDGRSSWANGIKAYGLSWTRPSTSIIRTAGEVWAQIDSVGSAADAAFKDTMRAKMDALVGTIDSLAGSHDVFHNYNQSVTSQLIDRMKDLKVAINQVASHAVTVGAARPTLTSQGASTSGQGVPGDVTSGHGNTQGEGSSPLLYAGLALGAVVLLAGGIYVFRSKGSMSGYRRRRSRR